MILTESSLQLSRIRPNPDDVMSDFTAKLISDPSSVQAFIVSQIMGAGKPIIRQVIAHK